MSVEETNQGQTNRLDQLRAAIQERKEVFETVKETPHLLQALSYSPVPSLTILSTSEFQMERYEQLCLIIDVLYFNWKLASKNNEQVEERLKDLATWVDVWIFESIKPRWK